MQGLPTEREIQLVKEHIILNVLVKLLPYEAHMVQQHGFRTGKLYAGVLDELHKKTIRQLTKNRSALKHAGVKIVSLDVRKGGARAEYVTKGYKFDMVLLDELIKAEIEERLSAALGLKI